MIKGNFAKAFCKTIEMICRLMEFYIRHFGSTLRNPHITKPCIALVTTKSEFYSNKKCIVWVSQIEMLKTYKDVLTLLPNPV